MGKRLLLITIITFTTVLSSEVNRAFSSAVEKFDNLVDYEAYETKLGKDVLLLCEEAAKENEVERDDTLKIYKNAVASGFAGTVLLKRNSYISGIAKMGESTRNWEKLVNSRFADEANFTLALTEYYKMTLFNKSPKNTAKLNAVMEIMRRVVAKDNEVLMKLSLSYIWVLREQGRFDEAKKLSTRFLAKFPDNTMMLRAMLAIVTDRKDVSQIKYYGKTLADISITRSPINYSDYLSAKNSEIFALTLENQYKEAQKIASETMKFSETIPAEYKKIGWVKKHLKEIERKLAELKNNP